MHSNINGMARDTFAILDKYLPLLEQVTDLRIRVIGFLQ